MRKTSHEGGDLTSVTSGVENEFKKSGAAAMKSKRNSIKKKVPVFSQESDITVTQPLLQTDKEGIDYADQSANEIISQVKTETNNKDESDDIIMLENNVNAFDVQSSAHTINENIIYKSQPNTIGAMHNHMNTNVFNRLDSSRNTLISRNQILVDIDGCKQVSYSSNPLIFTTAKIHSDGKNKHMEPVQVTPVPILSTVEVSVSKAGKCSEASSNILQSITSISDTNFNRDSKNTVPFTSHITSIQLKDTTGKSIISVTTHCNTTTEDSIKARKITQSDLPISVSTINNMENILLPTSQVSVVNSSTLKNESNGNAIISPIVHSTVTETVPTGLKLSTTFKETSKQSEIMKPTKFKNMEGVTSIPSQVRNNQVMCIVATNSSGISNNNKKDISSLVTHKILPRQKNSITENYSELDLKPKYVEDGSSDYGNGNKNTKDCSETKYAPMKPKIFELDSSSISDKILPKSSTNNVVSNISKLPKSTAVTDITEDPTNINSCTKSSKVTVPLYSSVTTQNTTTTKNTNSNITSSNQNMNILSSTSTEIIDTNKPKITKLSSVLTTSLSSVNVSPVISSISQHSPIMKPGPSSKITKPSVITTSLSSVNVSPVISSISENTPTMKPGPSSKITKPSSDINTSLSSVNVSPVISNTSQNTANVKQGPLSKITNPSSAITTPLISVNVSTVIPSTPQSTPTVKPSPSSKITKPSVITTSLSTVNVLPVISSTSQDTPTVKPGPSSKITKPSSVITTSLSTVNISPVISSTSQNTSTVKPGPSSKITKPSSVITTPLSSVNVSPVISSTSQNALTVKPGSSSKITKPSSVITTSLSSVNVSPVISSTSQNTANPKSGPSSKITNPSSVISTSLSSVNVSPVITSTSQNTPTVKTGPSSNITNPSSVITTSLSSVNVSPVISSILQNTPTVKTGPSSKITKPSAVVTTSLSCVNDSPVTSSTSQHVPNPKPGPSSNTGKKISLSTTADKSSTSLATPLSTSKLSNSKFPSSSLSSDKQLGQIDNAVMKPTENNIVEGQIKLSVTTGTKSKDFSKDVKSVKS